MTEKYTPEQTAEIAEFLEMYRIIYEEVETINNLRAVYNRGNPRMRGMFTDVAKSLRISINEFKGQVPQPIRDNLYNPSRFDELETLATNTLLELK